MRRSVLSALVMVLAVCGIANGAPIVWEVSDGGNGHAYDLIMETLTWHEAKIAAAALPLPHGFGPGHLLSISDATENEFVRANLTDVVEPMGDGAWAGFTDEVVEGEWRWIDDTPGIWQSPDNFISPIQTTYVNWGAPWFRPNSGTESDYLSFTRKGNWNDYFNDRPNPRYLVEWEPGCAPISSDLTDNCFVDADDLFVLLANWNQVGLPGDLFDNPSKPGIDDIDLFILLSEWTGPDPDPPTVAALGVEAVPEPSAFVLAVVGVLGTCCCRRRRRAV